jgi:glucose-6-phosphate isomerase
MVQHLGEGALAKHFIAITAAHQKAADFGIPDQHIFPIWEWIGGRYSIWSAIGLTLRLMIGNQHYQAFLQGAYEMDQHFQQAEMPVNMPMILAMLSIWYTNFFGSTAQAIVPYSHLLRDLISYLQQAEMESNGKSRSYTGDLLSYLTAPVIFGEEGCNAQHTYHQLLHQGQHLIPVDFILIGDNPSPQYQSHQDILIASCLSQAQALMHGKMEDEFSQHSPADASLSPTELIKHKVIMGNKPSNILLLHHLTPKNLGALLALYEHKIFVQSAVWDINPFDQWGVELGKQLLPSILNHLQHGKSDPITDLTIHSFIHYLRQLRENQYES